MGSAQVVETSITNNSPSQDSSHPDDLFQSQYVTPGFKPFSYNGNFVPKSLHKGWVESNRLSTCIESTLMMSRNDFNLYRVDLYRNDFVSKWPNFIILRSLLTTFSPQFYLVFFMKASNSCFSLHVCFSFKMKTTVFNIYNTAFELRFLGGHSLDLDTVSFLSRSVPHPNIIKNTISKVVIVSSDIL